MKITVTVSVEQNDATPAWGYHHAEFLAEERPDVDWREIMARGMTPEEKEGMDQTLARNTSACLEAVLARIEEARESIKEQAEGELPLRPPDPST